MVQPWLPYIAGHWPILGYKPTTPFGVDELSGPILGYKPSAFSASFVHQKIKKLEKHEIFTRKPKQEVEESIFQLEGRLKQTFGITVG